jgi:hypothetical protein
VSFPKKYLSFAGLNLSYMSSGALVVELPSVRNLG